jgi:hypothetical protein
MEDKTYLECECSSIEHVIRVDLFQDPFDKSATPEFFITMHLSPLPLFKRLIGGIKYIFGYRCRYGDFDETIVTYESVKELRRLCEKYERLYELHK